MPTVTINLPKSVFSALRKEPKQFVKELRLAAAVKWYEMGEITQEKAAEIAGITRTDFIFALKKYKIDFMQYTEEDLTIELKDAAR